MTMAVPNATEAKYLSSTIMPTHRALHTVHIYHNYCLYTFAPRTPRLYHLVTYAVVSAKPPPIILKFDSPAVPAEPTSDSHFPAFDRYLPPRSASIRCVDEFSLSSCLVDLPVETAMIMKGRARPQPHNQPRMGEIEWTDGRTDGQLLTWQWSRPNGQRSRLMARWVPLIRLPTKLLRTAKSDAKKRQREII